MVGGVQFSCQCGAVTGTLAQAGPRSGDHVVCHCVDCQKFASVLSAEARILGDFGGTALYQSRCAAMSISSGKDKLACMHLTEKPTLRWYASCCNTPMFNTYANGRVPYITTLLANCIPGEVERHIGPAVGHLFLPFEAQSRADLVPMSFSQLIRRFVLRMIKDLVAGDRKKSALFDPLTLEPIAKPQELALPCRPAQD
ncbi:DUF6151 family protein [Erythrobacter sp.]|uniref:DUF6151 family protein n=1 Tax=Erythrobacter sp. TaxID=1042 RepID=UPI00311E9A86